MEREKNTVCGEGIGVKEPLPEGGTDEGRNLRPEKVVFLDRDGTLNTEVNYLYRPEDLHLFPDVSKALARLKRDGFKLVVVTNQAGVARGYYKEEDVKELHRYMNGLLAGEGALIDHFFYCPHHPDHGIGEYGRDCDCRKPGWGMLKMAEEYYRVDKAHSYMIGDKLVDTEAGRHYGVTGILVGTGYGKEIRKGLSEEEAVSAFDFYAENLWEAVLWIEARERME